MSEHKATLADLKPDENNPRRHTPRNIGMIEHSLRSFGALRSIAIDEENRIRAGNGVAEAAAQAGMEKVRIIDIDDPEEVVALRFKHLTPEQKEAFAVADNRAGELAGWNGEVLADMADRGIALGELFRPEELARLTLPSTDTDFLMEYIGQDRDSDTATTRVDPDQKNQDPGDQGRFVQLAYAVTPEDRNVVQKALALAKAAQGLATSNEALVAVCAAYVEGRS